MMKKYFAVVLAGALSLSLCACGGQKEEAAQFSVQTVMDDMMTQVTVDDPFVMNENDLLDFFGIKEGDLEEFAAVTCGNGISAQEIVLVKAVDEDSAETVQEKLDNRLESRAAQAKDYLPEEYEIIQACETTRHGVYVSMIVHPEHESLEELYLSYVNGEK